MRVIAEAIHFLQIRLGLCPPTSQSREAAARKKSCSESHALGVSSDELPTGLSLRRAIFCFACSEVACHAVRPEVAHRGHARQAHWRVLAHWAASRPSLGVGKGASALCSDVDHPAFVGCAAGRRSTLSGARPSGQSTLPATVVQHHGLPGPPQLRDGRSRTNVDPAKHAAILAQHPSAVAPVVQVAPQDPGRWRGLRPCVPRRGHRCRVRVCHFFSYHLTKFRRVRLAVFVDDLQLDRMLVEDLQLASWRSRNNKTLVVTSSNALATSVARDLEVPEVVATWASASAQENGAAGPLFSACRGSSKTNTGWSAPHGPAAARAKGPKCSSVIFGVGVTGISPAHLKQMRSQLAKEIGFGGPLWSVDLGMVCMAGTIQRLRRWSSVSRRGGKVASDRRG